MFCQPFLHIPNQFKAFLEAVEADAALQEKVQTEASRYADAVVAIAKEAGFGIAADDVKRVQLEISEDDLKGVTGGGIWESPAAQPVPYIY